MSHKQKHKETSLCLLSLMLQHVVRFVYVKILHEPRLEKSLIMSEVGEDFTENMVLKSFKERVEVCQVK